VEFKILANEIRSTNASINHTVPKVVQLNESITNLTKSKKTTPPQVYVGPGPPPPPPPPPAKPPPFTDSGFNTNTLDEGWHHIAAVADGTKTTFYIDGAAVGEAPAVSKTDVYSIGNCQGGYHQWGDIDEFKLFSTQMTAEQLHHEVTDQIPLLASKKATLSASGTGAGCDVNAALLYTPGTMSWCSEKNDKSQWLQASLETPAIITAIRVGTKSPTPGKSTVSKAPVMPTQSTGSGSGSGSRAKKASPAARFVTRYRIKYSIDGSKWLNYAQDFAGPQSTPSTSMQKLEPPILASHVRIIPIAWAGGIAMSVEVHGVPSGSRSLKQVSVESAVGGSHAVAQCAPGWNVIGGGCNALNPPHLISSSAPESKTSWRCAGQGYGMKAMAICTPAASAAGLKLVETVGGSNLYRMAVPFTKGKSYYHKKAGDGDYGSNCPDTVPTLVSGGCNMVKSPYKAKYSFPSSNRTWICGGHGGQKNAFALCAAPKVFPWTQQIKRIVVVGKKSWVSATCPKGTVTVGGGCAALDKTQDFQYNGPDLPDADGLTSWTCGGLDSKKVVYTLCAPGTATGSYADPVTGARGSAMQNHVLPSCKCPKSCKCPTRNRKGFDTTAGVTRKNAIFGSYGFCAAARFYENKQKTPSCICPPRKPTKLHMEFQMKMPEDLAAFARKLQSSIELSLRTPGKECGCPKELKKGKKGAGVLEFDLKLPNGTHSNGTNHVLPPGGSCACRIAIDRIQKVVNKQPQSKSANNSIAQKQFHWRGDDSNGNDRWMYGDLDLVVVDARILPVEEQRISSGYHAGMSAESMADRFTQMVGHNESPLRRFWFFMHISRVAVSDRILKRCEIAMKTWSYRDAPSFQNVSSSASRARNKASASEISTQGWTDEGKEMATLVKTLKAVTHGAANKNEVAAAMTIGSKLAGQFKSASRPNKALSIENIMSKLSRTVTQKELQPSINNGPSQWSKLRKEWWRCDKEGSQSPIDLGSLNQTVHSFWKTNASDPNNVTYSNKKEDGLRIEYGTVKGQLLNEAVVLRVNFTGGQPTFTETGTNEKNHWRHNRYVGGSYNLSHALIHSPSEHTIAGKRFPMEIQFFHVNKKGDRAAVAVLLKFGFANDFLTSVFKESIPLQCSSSQILPDIHPGDAFPFSMDYFSYEGSLTAPPCSPVTWYVMKQQATLSLFQFIDYAKTLGTEEKYRMHCSRYGCTKTPNINDAEFPFSKRLGGNARPIQSLGNRRVRATNVPVAEQVAQPENDDVEPKHALDQLLPSSSDFTL